MSTKVEAGEYKLDGLKWLLVVLIIAAGTYGNSYYADFELIYRVLALIALGGLAAWVALATAKGQAFWTLVKEALVEVRKVVWPTRAETNQTTLLVTAVVIIAALVMKLFDWGITVLIKLVMV